VLGLFKISFWGPSFTGKTINALGCQALVRKKKEIFSRLQVRP